MSDRREQTSPRDDSAAVLGRVTDAVFGLDGELRFTYLNEAAERVFRDDEDELLGTVAPDALPDPAGEAFRREFDRATTTGEQVTFEEFHPALDAWFEVRAYPAEAAETNAAAGTGLSVYARDVTDRVRRRDRLRDRERALQRAYEIIADRERSFSRQVEDLLEVVRAALETDYATLSCVHRDADRYIFETVATPDDADLESGDTFPLNATNCERVVTTERTLVLDDVEVDAPELADRAANAEWGVSAYLGVPVFAGEEVYGTFCFYGMEPRTEGFSDWEVTFVELLGKWVSSELDRQRQNERLESFASMLAHELRNPLNVAQLYHRRAAAGDREAAEEVATALDRIEEMIDVMLVTARGTDSVVEREPVELSEAAAEAWTDATGDSPTDGAELVVETDRAVEADPIHLRHLLENLFANAVEHGSTSPRPEDEDAVERGGTGLTVRVGDLPDGTAGDDATDESVGGFYVADDGRGIPDGDRGRVFEAGYTTDETGIGLGLTFVRQLADAYGWNCAVTDSDAGGTRFEFSGVELADGDRA